MLVRWGEFSLVVYAKSKPVETLLEHTRNVLHECNTLRNSCYANMIIDIVPDQYREYFWDILLLVCKTHDLGKIQSRFQNKVRKRLNERELEIKDNIAEIPHNIISAAFISSYVKEYPSEIRPLICQAVGYHHARGYEFVEDPRRWALVKDAITKDVDIRMNELDDLYSDRAINLDYRTDLYKLSSIS